MWHPAIADLIHRELLVDRVDDDVTSRLLGSRAEEPGEATVFSKEIGIFSGVAICESFPKTWVRIDCLVNEGAKLGLNQTVATVHGSLRHCLAVERTLLNLLSHLCGVATQTRRFTEAVGSNRARILATRKTLPGLRDLQLQAVQAGGGRVHRRSLSDGILVKDNHLSFLSETEAVSLARESKSPLHRVEVEVQSLEQLTRILSNPPDIIMLDNFSLEQIRDALRVIDGRCEVEVSGNMTLERVAAVASLGVDYISVGRLTHSVPALDLSMDIRSRS